MFKYEERRGLGEAQSHQSLGLHDTANEHLSSTNNHNMSKHCGSLRDVCLFRKPPRARRDELGILQATELPSHLIFLLPGHWSLPGLVTLFPPPLFSQLAVNLGQTRTHSFSQSRLPPQIYDFLPFSCVRSVLS